MATYANRVILARCHFINARFSTNLKVGRTNKQKTNIIVNDRQTVNLIKIMIRQECNGGGEDGAGAGSEVEADMERLAQDRKFCRPANQRLCLYV